MRVLSEEFLEQCSTENGFRIRGREMTRVEVFVDAAFAFAVTMLVISFDAIPRTFPEMVMAIKTIPAFVAAVAQLIWIWRTHAQWCQRFGLDDEATVWLSALLLVVVLIYIYPMRVMLEGMFAWLSGGYLASSFDLRSWEELRFMFVFMGTAFAALCLTFVLMYRYALSHEVELRLNHVERQKTANVVRIWAGCAVLGTILAALALLLPLQWVPFAGFVLFLIGAWIPWVETRHPITEPSTQEI
jgi:hypothetical protein